jgi:hypothetical protein
MPTEKSHTSHARGDTGFWKFTKENWCQLSKGGDFRSSFTLSEDVERRKKVEI